MNKKILMALCVSVSAASSSDALVAAKNAEVNARFPVTIPAATTTTAATAAVVRYDFDVIARNPNALNAFTKVELIALQGQLSAAQAGRGQGFGAFDKKLALLQGYVSQRLAGQTLAIAQTLPMMTRPEAGVVAIDMFSVTKEDLNTKQIRDTFRAQLNALKAVSSGSYHTQAGTKAKADAWSAWLATQDVVAQ